MSSAPYFDRKSKILLVAIVVVSICLQVFGLSDSLDLRFFYSGYFAIQFLSSLTEELRQRYIHQCLIDLVFIYLYSTLGRHEFKRLTSKPWLQLSALVPGFFDTMETTSILMMLVNGKIPMSLDWLGVVTSIKWIASVLISVVWFVLWKNSRKQIKKN